MKYKIGDILKSRKGTLVQIEAIGYGFYLLKALKNSPSEAFVRKGYKFTRDDKEMVIKGYRLINPNKRKDIPWL